ncbi:MAG: alpha/beta hydrolase, partial [Alphaproteobacteria bacterium]
WRLCGTAVDPAAIGFSCLVVIAQRDRIVPGESSYGLARALPKAHILSLEAGHVGMIVGSRAKRLLWRPLRDWLLSASLD